MAYDLTNYDTLNLIYDVAYDLSQSLESECLQGKLDDSQIAVLSGSYSVIDWVANRIAALGLEGDAGETYQTPSIQKYKVAPKLMDELAKSLAQNLFTSYSSGIVDYKKVQAIAGLNAIIPYIEEISRIIED